MSFSRKIKYWLVHTRGLSNKEAQALLDAGQVQADGITVRDNCPVDDFSEIALKGEVLRPQKLPLYLKFHKPPGYESTLHAGVAGNLSEFFTGYSGLAIAGRLDKLSEGLLLLSNNGKWIEQLCNPGSEKEKEYLVRLDRAPDPEFFRQFTQGVRIGNHFTRPCRCEPTADAATLRIILTEGKNRQIHRMCWNLGYKVLNLKRIRMADVDLGDLAAGELSSFTPNLQKFNTKML